MVKKEYDLEILQAMDRCTAPAGAVYLSGVMDIPPANIGRTLLRLEKQGLVEKVQNKGRIITERGRRFLEQSEAKNSKILVANELIDSAEANSIENLLEIMELRKLLEGYTAETCAEVITEQQLHELEGIHFDYFYELCHGRAGREQDLALHLKIAEICGNRTIEKVLRLILTDNDTYAEFTNAAVQLHNLRQDGHGRILEAIRNRDGKTARAEMEKHLNRVIENVERNCGRERG